MEKTITIQVSEKGSDKAPIIRNYQIDPEDIDVFDIDLFDMIKTLLDEKEEF
ncbi:hypothetical protein M0R04_10760 [Candidatus Dojkabacteria bacterium]|jgi:hypothetical protein|nr:hypothetical protein [Candidatus Dojkabacteria bacterium]